MLMPLKRVIVFVGDLDRRARFYVDVFGFVALPSDQSPAERVELETGGCRLAFHQARGAEGAIDSPTGGPMNPHKIVFFAADVEAARAAVVGKAYRLGELVFCDGKDPEGHVFQISNRE